MRTILVADDDRNILKPVCKYLSTRDKEFKILAATSGAESIEILKSERIDLVLSDLRMPDGDGIDILAYLSTRSEPIPVILMSGFVDSDAAEALSRFGHLRFLSKPAPLSQIFAAVKDALLTGDEMGSFSGFSLASVLQLVEMEDKTGMVEVRNADGRVGGFVFAKGSLKTALLDDLDGEDAALEMLTWESPQVKVVGAPDTAAWSSELKCNVTGLLMRSVKSKDEKDTPEDQNDPVAGMGFSGFVIDEQVLQEVALATEEARRAEELAAAAKEEVPTASPLKVRPTSQEEDVVVAAYKNEPVERDQSVLYFLAMAGVAVGTLGFLAATENSTPTHGWVTVVAFAMVYLLVLADAFRTGPGYALLGLVFPPYLLAYVPLRVASPALRAAFFATLLTLAVEAFLLPEQSILPSLMEEIRGLTWQ